MLCILHAGLSISVDRDRSWSGGHGEQESDWIRGTFVERKSRVEAQVTGPVFLRPAVSFGLPAPIFITFSRQSIYGPAFPCRPLHTVGEPSVVYALHCTTTLSLKDTVRGDRGSPLR